ncbi:hypothetical protein [uncultured Tenacibaculum sp.]|uniref:hypothetical protein n=1 Tax=uncultured Tenacibaculum sp. TaxID=174713 RepID=UPI002629646F|nr:hypothetical protein [uncultured Tenacibaculum sp.]
MKSKYDLDPKELFKILTKKKIKFLYHANTISTSKTFLNNKSLFSRKYIEDNKLFQTKQYSDEKDKKIGVWDGIFLDAIDIHEEFNRANLYGPFLFSLDLKLLESEHVKTVKITKKNPVHWALTESNDNWYYSDLKEFNENYKIGNKRKDVGSMFIFEDIDGVIPLAPYLKRITLDNPNLYVSYNNKDKLLSNIVKEEIDELLNKNGFEGVEKVLRHKFSNITCSCWREYKRLRRTELKKLFHVNP